MSNELVLRTENLLIGHEAPPRTYITDENGYEGSDKTMYDIHEAFRKHTAQALTDNKLFFEKLTNIQKIYSYGFSYSEVDMPYMKKICSKIAKNATWYFNDYDWESHEMYKKKLRNCGFLGTFDKFHIAG